MDYDKNSEALILCANCKAMDKIDTVENNFVWIPIIKCIKGGFYLKLAQNIVFLFSSEMRGSTIRLYTDDRSHWGFLTFF